MKIDSITIRKEVDKDHVLPANWSDFELLFGCQTSNTKYSNDFTKTKKLAVQGISYRLACVVGMMRLIWSSPKPLVSTHQQLFGKRIVFGKHTALTDLLRRNVSTMLRPTTRPHHWLNVSRWFTILDWTWASTHPFSDWMSSQCYKLYITLHLMSISWIHHEH